MQRTHVFRVVCTLREWGLQAGGHLDSDLYRRIPNSVNSPIKRSRQIIGQESLHEKTSQYWWLRTSGTWQEHPISYFYKSQACVSSELSIGPQDIRHCRFQGHQSCTNHCHLDVLVKIETWQHFTHPLQASRPSRLSGVKHLINIII